jgi:hypothetical protein
VEPLVAVVLAPEEVELPDSEVPVLPLLPAGVELVLELPAPLVPPLPCDVDV